MREENPTSSAKNMNEQYIINLIKNDLWRMEVLECAKDLNLPDWYIAAGFVRNLVWDDLHHLSNPTPLSDIDVVYYDKENLSEEHELHLQDLLNQKLSAEWSVTNQVRMAKVNGEKDDYISSEDAISRFPETATAIGVRMLEDGSLKVIAPYGLDDLFSLRLKMSPRFIGGKEKFLYRVQKKNWLSKWSRLKLVD